MESLKSLKDRLPGRSSSSSTTPSSSSSSSSITGLGLRGKAGKATSYVTSKASSIRGGGSSSDSSNVSVRPISALRDPSTFAPPPKRSVSVRGVPRSNEESYENDDYHSGTVRRGTYPSSGTTSRTYDMLEEGDEEEYDHQHQYYDQRGAAAPPPPPLAPRPRIRSDTAPAVVESTSSFDARKPPPPPPKRIGTNTPLATIGSLGRDRGDSAPPRPAIADTPPPLPPRLPPRRETISTYTPPTPSPPPPLNTEFPASPAVSSNSRSESASSSPTRRRPPPPPPGPRPSTGTSSFTSTPLNLSTVSLHAPPHMPPPPVSSSPTTADKLAALKTAQKLSATGDPTKVSFSEAKNAFIVGREIEAKHGAEIREVAKGAERAGVGAGVVGGPGTAGVGVGGVRKWGVVETGGLLGRGRGSGLVR